MANASGYDNLKYYQDNGYNGLNFERPAYLQMCALQSFNATDKSRIIPVINKNPDNQWYGSKGGADTRDSIFLLSVEEVVCQHFGDSSSKLQNRGKNQRYWFARKDENSSKRIARLGANNRIKFSLNYN
ncbi:DUF6273 domain-containing protein [Anaerocolumna xylanovorans]|uniref:DUF6273 domain-containing protein n=1 Tax=Anaerocolumna xylanovorans TaxID=100134 RepID=UPI002E8E516A|nr:DUF6273 domain-containing protein [Anaerocolumna xylanovorans]